MVKEEEKTAEENEKNVKEVIKPILVVPKIDREQHAVFKTTTEKDAEFLRTALSNPSGVYVLGPGEEKKKVCPSEPDKPYSESICRKLEEHFKKDKKKKDKKE